MTERELDEKALAKAAQAVSVDMWRVTSNPGTIARAAITAYLAACPTPDADAMERKRPDSHAFKTAMCVFEQNIHDWNRIEPNAAWTDDDKREFWEALQESRQLIHSMFEEAVQR